MKKKIGRPRKFKNPVRMSVVMSKEQAEKIKEVAVKMSWQEGRNITPSEAIRMAIETIYKLPKQQEFKF